MKLDALGNFAPLYFFLNFIAALPRSYSRARKLCFWVISENNYTNLYKHLWLFGSKKGNINFWKFITIWA